ncbi:MAG: hypothetical protein RMY36_030825 [Nostoc sp. SerVER01]|nr:hypothetical protein [Nostoc sp. SerVER01]
MSNPNIEKCIEILHLTSDGDRLSPPHLKLVEIAVNGGLSELGQQELDRIYGLVKAGNYCDWFHGIEHLTQGHDGYVYWKGQCVEHFSFSDYEVEELAAQAVAERCRYLESIGAQICIANVTCEPENIRLNS